MAVILPLFLLESEARLVSGRWVSFLKRASLMFRVVLCSAVAMVISLSTSDAAAQGGAFVVRKGRVQALQTWTMSWDNPSAGLVGISIVGDGDTDLDLFVFDSSGRLIKKADGPSDREGVLILAPRGNLTIVVQNLGIVYNDFVIVIGGQ
jgi:hypothetical protein